MYNLFGTCIRNDDKITILNLQTHVDIYVLCRQWLGYLLYIKVSFHYQLLHNLHHQTQVGLTNHLSAILPIQM